MSELRGIIDKTELNGTKLAKNKYNAINFILSFFRATKQLWMNNNLMRNDKVPVATFDATVKTCTRRSDG